MRYLTLTALLLVAACATSVQPDRVVMTSCTAYASALESLAVRREAGLLSDQVILQVDALREVATPICTSPAPSAGDRATLDAVLLELERILAQRAAQES